MIPIYLQNTVQNNNHAVNALIDLLVDEIASARSDANSSFRSASVDPRFNFNNTDICGTLFDITKFIPLWVLKEKTERINNGEEIFTIYDFLQKYYDWLYCDNQSGAQYSLSKNILDLIDIRKTKENLIENLYNVYAQSFNGVFESSTLDVGRSELEKFLISIRKNFYHRKGTEDGIRKLLTTLFVIDERDIEIEIPKQFILRLNGGKFTDDNLNFTFRTGTGDTGGYLEKGDLSGSYLNFSRLHDTNWFHDYSYLLFVGTNYNDNDDLEELYRKSNHPIGTHLIFGKQLSDFESVQPNVVVGTICEYPMLRNYAPYSLNITYGALGNIDGNTFYGLTACIGCCGASFSGFTGPTHRFPSWTQTITESVFGNINIQDFITLCYEGLTSPNENLLNCNGCN
jgi:hypothetical protein